MISHSLTKKELIAARIRLHHFINSAAYIGQDEVIVPIPYHLDILDQKITPSATTDIKSVTYRKIIDEYGAEKWIVKTFHSPYI